MDQDAFDREVTCWQTGRGCEYLIKVERERERERE
jgi:hypothetical protein